jgi:hypothetical protein
MGKIFDIMQNIPYNSPNNVNAQQLIGKFFPLTPKPGMLSATMNKQAIPGMMMGGGSVPDWGSQKKYSPEVIRMIQRFIQTASGGGLSYGGKLFSNNPKRPRRIPSEYIFRLIQH